MSAKKQQKQVAIEEPAKDVDMESDDDRDNNNDNIQSRPPL